MRVYISGPISGTEDYRERFLAAAVKIRSMGSDVVNPAAIEEVLPVDDYEEIMDICLSLMDKCDAIVMLPGWRKSIGCNREYGYAMGREMMVIEYETLVHAGNT